MKNKRLEIRIEEEKKQYLETEANKMNLKVSELLSLMIDNYINNDTSVKYYLNNVSEIAIQLVKLNLLASQVNNEIRDEILKELEALECLM